MLSWNIYEFTSQQPIHGVKMRGRLRQFALINKFDMLVENAEKERNVVRFALLDNKHLQPLSDYIHSIVPDAEVKMVWENCQNPVLSKLKINKTERYAHLAP